MRGAAWRTTLNVPLRWVAITASKSLSSIFTRVRSRTIPALFTTMSIRPNASTAASTIRPAPSKSDTESRAATAVPPASSMAATHLRRRILGGLVTLERDPDVVHHDRGALARQRERELTAEAATRSRHHGHPTVQQAASVF